MKDYVNLLAGFFHCPLNEVLDLLEPEERASLVLEIVRTHTGAPARMLNSQTRTLFGVGAVSL